MRPGPPEAASSRPHAESGRCTALLSAYTEQSAGQQPAGMSEIEPPVRSRHNRRSANDSSLKRSVVPMRLSVSQALGWLGAGRFSGQAWPPLPRFVIRRTLWNSPASAGAFLNTQGRPLVGNTAHHSQYQRTGNCSQRIQGTSRVATLLPCPLLLSVSIWAPHTGTRQPWTAMLP